MLNLSLKCTLNCAVSSFFLLNVSVGYTVVAYAVISFIIVSKLSMQERRYLTSGLGVVPLDSFKTMLSALEN